MTRCRRRAWIGENRKALGGNAEGHPPRIAGAVKTLADVPAEDPGHSYADANRSLPHRQETDARSPTPVAFAWLLQVQPWLRAAPVPLSEDQDVGRSADDLRVVENMSLGFEEPP